MRLDSEGGAVVIAACLVEDVVVVLMRLVVVVVLKELQFPPRGPPNAAVFVCFTFHWNGSRAGFSSLH